MSDQQVKRYRVRPNEMHSTNEYCDGGETGVACNSVCADADVAQLERDFSRTDAARVEAERRVADLIQQLHDVRQEFIKSESDLARAREFEADALRSQLAAQEWVSVGEGDKAPPDGRYWAAKLWSSGRRESCICETVGGCWATTATVYAYLPCPLPPAPPAKEGGT